MWIPLPVSSAHQTISGLEIESPYVTIGRDIELDPPTKQPLNYFIYPYAEADGETAGTGTISLDYRDVPPENRRAVLPASRFESRSTGQR